MALSENAGLVKQNILISSSNKSDISNLNNDITLRFPSKVFFKPPTSIQLVSFDIKSEVSTFGNTNNHFLITLNPDDLGNIRDFNVVPHFNPFIPDDLTLAAVVEAALNCEVTEFINPSLTEKVPSPNPDVLTDSDTYAGLVFTCVHTSIEIIVDNYKVEQDDSTSIYTITSTRPVKLQFDVKDSIGPIMGFGNGVYDNITNVEGTSVQSIEKYNSISGLNDSILLLDTISQPFPNYNDINCKMELYDSTNTRIPNIDHPGTPGSYGTDPGDTTISLGPAGTGAFYKNIWEILEIVESELNRYSASFTPAAEFRLSYDYSSHRVTITNVGGTSPARFGISFDFSVIDNGNRLTSGSMHKTLGFNQETYLGQTTYTSLFPTRTFGNVFADDYILLCSDLISNNSDRNVIGISNGNSVKSNNILFAIPESLASNFSPTNTDNYTLNIESSTFSIGYKENVFDASNPAELNFYIRLLSGRHLQATASWSSLISFTY